MNKDDILKEAQKANQGAEYEHRTEIKSNLLSALAALCVGAFLFFFEYLRNGSCNWGIAAIALTACSTQSLFEGIKLKKPLLIIVGAVQLILALVSLIAAVLKLVR